MEFSWVKNVAKAFSAALVGAAVAAVAGVLAIAFGAVDSLQELSALQVPAYFAPVVLYVVESLRNFLKHKLGLPL